MENKVVETNLRLIEIDMQRQQFSFSSFELIFVGLGFIQMHEITINAIIFFGIFFKITEFFVAFWS